MIVGVCINESEKEQLKGNCERVIQIDLADFKKIIHPKTTYLFVDVYALKLSIVGIAELFKYVEESGGELVFLDNLGLSISEISDFFKLSAEVYRKIASKMATDGLLEAKAAGNICGRPPISNEKISQIRYLYHNDYSMRQIAAECEVSLGTIYNYCR